MSPFRDLFKRKTITEVPFDAQWSVFRGLGFELNTGTTLDDLKNMWGADHFEAQPFSLMYASLGAELEREPHTPFTNRCLHFDTECIEQSGDYVKILKNLARISGGELQFGRMADVVDLEAEKTALAFDLFGETFQWALAFDGDWVDPTLFSQLVSVISKHSTSGKFTYYNTGGQDCVIGWATEQERQALKSATGLKIEWMK